MESGIFYFFSALTVLFSLNVIFLKNPISSALSLVASFFCVSALFIMMHATFLGIIQVLIYAGAILVLFLYVLMLINLQDENWIFDRTWDFKNIFQSLSIVALMSVLTLVYLEIPEMQVPEVDPSFGTIESIGKVLLSDHVLAFEWISLLLYVGILGVIAVSSKKKERGAG